MVGGQDGAEAVQEGQGSLSMDKVMLHELDNHRPIWLLTAMCKVYAVVLKRLPPGSTVWVRACHEHDPAAVLCATSAGLSGKSGAREEAVFLEGAKAFDRVRQ